MEVNKIKIKLAIAIVINCQCLIWAAPSIFENYTHYFSYEDNSFTTGLKAEFSMAKGTLSTNFENYNFGLSLFSEKYLKTIPIELSFGNISIGGLLSKFKNPMIDSASTGFDSCLSEITENNCTFPGYTSFSKPLSSFIELGYNSDEYLIKKIICNGTYNLNSKEMDYSTFIELGWDEKIILKNASGISIYTLEENNFTSWYSKEPYYSSKKIICFGTQFGINIYNINNMIFSCFAYETPFGKIKPVFKIENKFEWKDLSFGLSAFFNKNSHIVSKENLKLSPCTQLKGNIQYNFNISSNINNEDSLKIGFTIYSKIPFYDSPGNLKVGVSSKIDILFISAILECCSSFDFDLLKKNWDFNYGSVKLDTALNFSYINPKIGAACKFYKSSQNYAISLAFTLQNDLLLGVSTFSFSNNNGLIYNKKLKMGLTFNGKYKKILVIMKINGDFCI